MAGLTIGKLAAAAGVGVETVRFYQRRGLLAQPPRPGPGFWEYTGADQERLAFIRRAQRLGFTLAEIRDLLGHPGGNTLRLTREQCVAQINALEQQKRGLEIAIAELRQIYSSFYRKLLEQPD